MISLGQRRSAREQEVLVPEDTVADIRTEEAIHLQGSADSAGSEAVHRAAATRLRA